MMYQQNNIWFKLLTFVSLISNAYPKNQWYWTDKYLPPQPYSPEANDVIDQSYNQKKDYCYVEIYPGAWCLIILKQGGLEWSFRDHNEGFPLERIYETNPSFRFHTVLLNAMDRSIWLPGYKQINVVTGGIRDIVKKEMPSSKTNHLKPTVPHDPSGPRSQEIRDAWKFYKGRDKEQFRGFYPGLMNEVRNPAKLIAIDTSKQLMLIPNDNSQITHQVKYTWYSLFDYHRWRNSGIKPDVIVFTVVNGENLYLCARGDSLLIAVPYKQIEECTVVKFDILAGVASQVGEFTYSSIDIRVGKADHWSDRVIQYVDPNLAVFTPYLPGLQMYQKKRGNMRYAGNDVGVETQSDVKKLLQLRPFDFKPVV